MHSSGTPQSALRDRSRTLRRMQLLGSLNGEPAKCVQWYRLDPLGSDGFGCAALRIWHGGRARMAMQRRRQPAPGGNKPAARSRPNSSPQPLS